MTHLHWTYPWVLWALPLAALLAPPLGVAVEPAVLATALPAAELELPASFVALPAEPESALGSAPGEEQAPTTNAATGTAKDQNRALNVWNVSMG